MPGREKDWVLRLAAAVEKSVVQLKHDQVRFKRNFYRRLLDGKTIISESYYIWMDVEYGKAKDTLSGHTKGPYTVLDHTTRKLVLQKGGVVKR